jgi:hypothetical protein
MVQGFQSRPTSGTERSMGKKISRRLWPEEFDGLASRCPAWLVCGEFGQVPDQGNERDLPRLIYCQCRTTFH